MVRKITVIRKYRPEIKRDRTRDTRMIAEDIAQWSSLNKGEILFVLYELHEAILMAHRSGQAVKLDGLGTFTPTIRMDGSLDVLFRPEVDLLNKLNDPSHFHAKILNKSNIGKSADELVAQWNQEHPEDPVQE